MNVLYFVSIVLTVQKGQKWNFNMLFLLYDIQNMFKNVCVCVINTCKSSQGKNSCVQVGNKEFFILLHKGDFIVFSGSSEQESTYADIIFL